jgi:hypothetical protein
MPYSPILFSKGCSCVCVCLVCLDRARDQVFLWTARRLDCVYNIPIICGIHLIFKVSSIILFQLRRLKPESNNRSFSNV